MGLLAAVKDLNAVVAPLCRPGRVPTLAEGQRAWQALKQLLTHHMAFGEAYSRALLELCGQLESVLDDQQFRETRAGGEQQQNP